MKRSPARSFGRLLKRNVLVLPGAYDCLSALLIKKAGFPAIYVTGAGLSVSFLGKPDIGLLTMNNVVDTTQRMAEAVDSPLLVDGDTGFGGPLKVKQLVQELERAGAAGVQIEDQTFPKRCGHLSGKEVVPPIEMVQKIKAAVGARKNPHFVIVARTDARAVEGLEAALKRAQVYKKAGADVIFPEALESISEFKAFGQKKGLGVLMANMTEFGRSPALTVSELAHLGYRVVLYPMTAFRVAALAMENALKELHSKGHSQSLIRRMQTRDELYELIRYNEKSPTLHKDNA